jgi:hypothetical protein
MGVDMSEQAVPAGDPPEQAAAPQREVALRDPPSALRALQFDYAWKWFAFHADQRTKMFNFMLAVAGIFAAGILSALDKVPSPILILLCIVAAIIPLIFMMLDRRNTYLVRLGEEMLIYLERKAIFGQGAAKFPDRKSKDKDFGILWRQESEHGERNKLWLGYHRWWLRIISLLIALFFLSVGTYILCRDSWGRGGVQQVSSGWVHRVCDCIDIRPRAARTPR